MNNILKYKGYEAIIGFDAEDRVFNGRVAGLRDVVTFEGDSLKALECAFRESVDEYLAAFKWNYRVIEFDGADGEPWRAIHEVHYCNDQPAAYSDTPAGIVWHPTAGGWEDPRALLARVAAAIDKPILTPADFPSERGAGEQVSAPTSRASDAPAGPYNTDELS